ncbi:putative metal-binding protein [Encephalitozoon intestinalis ATCC 50506]|uniref:Metal-binding protein n=1 Tax=Encephalitozoon intestinalis (strain ATCC 50506) TaxID=876142 RepID=E0S9I4_ENCIT|nr:putative metal-binding protein [Encephalitozoon intestinalis ATCC 50506]ADM12369.1 putative metal-binding protein [Encephalitozoon intestinalis ATCC 50506]UTX46201.1 hypothetical protein GPK93_10g17990 [Encephalitozoon intestinalis]
MLELPPDTRKGFLYLVDREVFSKFKGYVDLDFLYEEDHGEVKVASVSVLEDSFMWSEGNEEKSALPSEFRCSHGNEITHKSLNLLPQEGWEELIDCWSCHNCEFRTMLDLKLRPREGGLLLSDFFFLVNDRDLPECCRKNDSSVRKLFYNEIEQEEFTHRALIYSYMNLHFRNKNVLLLEVNEKKYEIRYFYKTMLVSANGKSLEKKEAMKVGIKETDKLLEENKNINNFYSKLIWDAVTLGAVGITALGYGISFVTEK